MTLESSVTEVERWIEAQGIPRNELTPPITADQLVALRAAFPLPLSEDFLTLYSRHDGFPHWLILEDTWHLLDSEMISELYRENQDVFDDIIATEPWRAEWLPLLSNGAGDYLLLDLKTREVGSYFHEGGEYEVAYSDLAAYFNHVAEGFRVGRYEFCEDDGMTFV
ncbi:SMI1/KNR4 family protein [Deinococcus sp. Arct2-2]|uniref:SMI1/KNR4 family protein n=1 Tax=Deinococcus sp. Arct2-2 TaxID=2568653 RepID=UPI0010A531F9|nr:SMI1/KNR4 family protein [Deinococcus sp. Arct2-2]THF70812.1 SMI1/KNR4 family protein [Deinococcus sp. Arct2-2]